MGLPLNLQSPDDCLLLAATIFSEAISIENKKNAALAQCSYFTDKLTSITLEIGKIEAFVAVWLSQSRDPSQDMARAPGLPPVLHLVGRVTQAITEAQTALAIASVDAAVRDIFSSKFAAAEKAMKKLPPNILAMKAAMITEDTLATLDQLWNSVSELPDAGDPKEILDAAVATLNSAYAMLKGVVIFYPMTRDKILRLEEERLQWQSWAKKLEEEGRLSPGYGFNIPSFAVNFPVWQLQELLKLPPLLPADLSEEGKISAAKSFKKRIADAISKLPDELRIPLESATVEDGSLDPTLWLRTLSECLAANPQLNPGVAPDLFLQSPGGIPSMDSGTASSP